MGCVTFGIAVAFEMGYANRVASFVQAFCKIQHFGWNTLQAVYQQDCMLATG
jgi:hypothetical protein